ncbi:MAG: hypothetical protein K1X57_01470 [Gemmataceae bacterium]|nr:hypothetical protein [Gemmataceae bacterium]
MSLYQVENIERRRAEAGIDDSELRNAIPRLRPGDRVTVTIRNSARLSETVTVRVVQIVGGEFVGSFASRPLMASLRRLGADATLQFEANNIHSILAASPALPES